MECYLLRTICGRVTVQVGKRTGAHWFIWVLGRRWGRRGTICALKNMLLFYLHGQRRRPSEVILRVLSLKDLKGYYWTPMLIPRPTLWAFSMMDLSRFRGYEDGSLNHLQFFWFKSQQRRLWIELCGIIVWDSFGRIFSIGPGRTLRARARKKSMALPKCHRCFRWNPGKGCNGSKEL